MLYLCIVFFFRCRFLYNWNGFFDVDVDTCVVCHSEDGWP